MNGQDFCEKHTSVPAGYRRRDLDPFGELLVVSTESQRISHPNAEKNNQQLFRLKHFSIFYI